MFEWTLFTDLLGAEAVLLGYAVYEMRFGRLAQVHEALKTHSLVIVALATAVDEVDESVVSDEIAKTPSKEDFLSSDDSAIDCCTDDDRPAALGMADTMRRTDGGEDVR